MITALIFSALCQRALADPPEPESIRASAVTYDDQLKYKPDFQSFRYANPNAPKGGEIRIGYTGSFTTLNPFYLRGRAPSYIQSLVFQRLGAVPEDDYSASYGVLAKSVEIAADKSWMAVELRPEARWHDGTPLTAEDVAFSLATLTRYGKPAYSSKLGGVKSATVENAHRIVFRFANGENRQMPRELFTMPIISKAYYSKVPFNQISMVPPMGSGPYRVASFQSSGSEIVYERVRDYWAKDLPAQRGLFNFDRVVIDFYMEGAILFEAFKAGAVDVIWDWDLRRWATGYDFPAAKRGDVKRLLIKVPGAIGANAISLNMRQKRFQDRRVRAAFDEMFDFEWINKNYMSGGKTRAYSFFQGGADLENPAGPPSDEELRYLNPLRALVPPEVFGPGFRPPAHSPGDERSHLVRAFELLKAAGCRFVRLDSGEPFAGRMLDPEGKPFDVDLIDSDPSGLKYTLFFAKSLSRLGIVIRPRLVDPAEFQRAMQDFDFDATYDYMPGSDAPGAGLRDLLGSAAASTTSSNNQNGVADPAVDQLINDVIASRNRRENAAAARALDRVIMWNRYYLPTWADSVWRFAYWNKFGHPAYDKPEPFDPVIEWWAK